MSDNKSWIFFSCKCQVPTVTSWKSMKTIWNLDISFISIILNWVFNWGAQLNNWTSVYFPCKEQGFLRFLTHLHQIPDEATNIRAPMANVYFPLNDNRRKYAEFTFKRNSSKTSWKYLFKYRVQTRYSAPSVLALFFELPRIYINNKAFLPYAFN